MAELLQLRSPTMTQPVFLERTERGETEEERKTGWSQTEEQGEKAQARPSSDHKGKRTIFGKQA